MQFFRRQNERVGDGSAGATARPCATDRPRGVAHGKKHEIVLNGPTYNAITASTAADVSQPIQQPPFKTEQTLASHRHSTTVDKLSKTHEIREQPTPQEGTPEIQENLVIDWTSAAAVHETLAMFKHIFYSIVYHDPQKRFRAEIKELIASQRHYNQMLQLLQLMSRQLQLLSTKVQFVKVYGHVRGCDVSKTTCTFKIGRCLGAVVFCGVCSTTEFGYNYRAVWDPG